MPVIPPAHGAAHAWAPYRQKNAEPVQKITIVPHTEGSLGYTLLMPEEDKTNLRTRDELMAKIAVSMGGRAAEEVIMHTMTNGASPDHQEAPHTPPRGGQPLPVIKGKGSTEAPVRQKRGTNKDILYSRGENTGDSFITAAQQLARSDSKGRSNKKALQTLVRAGFVKDSGDGEFQFADVHEVPRRNRKFFDKVFSAYEDESDKY